MTWASWRTGLAAVFGRCAKAANVGDGAGAANIGDDGAMGLQWMDDIAVGFKAASDRRRRARLNEWLRADMVARLHDVLTAIAVSVSGIIAFVGLIIPHFVRLLVGPSHRRLLPLSMLMGAALLSMADLLARTIVSPTELPVGVVTTFIGAPVFVYLLRRGKRT